MRVSVGVSVGLGASSPPAGPARSSVGQDGRCATMCKSIKLFPVEGKTAGKIGGSLKAAKDAKPNGGKSKGNAPFDLMLQVRPPALPHSRTHTPHVASASRCFASGAASEGAAAGGGRRRLPCGTGWCRWPCIRGRTAGLGGMPRVVPQMANGDLCTTSEASHTVSIWRDGVLSTTLVPPKLATERGYTAAPLSARRFCGARGPPAA